MIAREYLNAGDLMRVRDDAYHAIKLVISYGCRCTEGSQSTAWADAVTVKLYGSHDGVTVTLVDAFAERISAPHDALA